MNQPNFGPTRSIKRVTTSNEPLIKGINTVADAVGSTLGALGQTVVIEDDFGGVMVTKDGVTVAKSILLFDPQENLGSTMVKQAASMTNSKAGDGTTTSTVLAQAIIHEYMAAKDAITSHRDVKAGINKQLKLLLKELTKRSLKVDSKRLNHVSIISTNNDTELGTLIAKAFRDVGDNGVVTVETSPTSDTYIKAVEGTQVNATCSKPYFYTDLEKEVAELEKPLIFLSVSEIPNTQRILSILEHAASNNRSILFIAPMSEQVLQSLAMNKVKGNLKVNVIEPPSFGQKRSDLLEDLSLLVGGKVFNEGLGDSLDAIDLDFLGEADKTISDRDGTIIVVNDKPEAVENKVAELQKAYDNEVHAVLRKHLEVRLSLLCGGVSILNIGAATDLELVEKKARVEDAVQAVKAAKKAGILPGGGAALLYLAQANAIEYTDDESLGVHILNKAVQAPYNKILSNAGLSHENFHIKSWGTGVDVIDGQIKNMVKAGIIDPTLVTKEALENAVSVATTILSTGTIISNIRLDE